ncbi:hypothetical protein MKX03_037378, partial [Papaver bracteatum]
CARNVPVDSSTSIVYHHKATTKSAALGVNDQKNFVKGGMGGYASIGGVSGALGGVGAAGGVDSAGGVGSNWAIGGVGLGDVGGRIDGAGGLVVKVDLVVSMVAVVLVD